MTADDHRGSRRVNRNILEIVRKIVSRIKKFLRSIKSGCFSAKSDFTRYDLIPPLLASRQPIDGQETLTERYEPYILSSPRPGWSDQEININHLSANSSTKVGSESKRTHLESRSSGSQLNNMLASRLLDDTAAAVPDRNIALIMCAVFAPGRVINFGSSRGET